MVVLLLFSFLAGIFTVLSPCILPILPAILSSGTIQGKRRPVGILLGLVSSFTFFTLSLTTVVRATGVSPDALRYLAIGMICAFGLVMTFPRLSDLFAKTAAPIAALGLHLKETRTGSGLGGGFVFGVALGLLWTPCAGPILAAITTLVATQSVDFITVLITMTYSLGAAIPMCLIAYGGSKAIQSSRSLSAHAEEIRQVFGIFMILTGLSILFRWDMLLQQKIATIVPPVVVEDNDFVKKQLEKLRINTSTISGLLPDVLSNFGKAPEITGIINWINSPPLSIMQLKDKVVLIDFWTYSCINCLRTLPYLKQWHDKYKDDGLVIIGVHTPEFEFEKDYKNVAAAALRLSVKYPIAQDNDYKTWQAYNNHYWPAHYLIDTEGNLRMAHFGEGQYVETENAIRALLGKSALKMQESPKSMNPISPETYLGTSRGRSYTREILLQTNREQAFDYKTPLREDQAGLKGLWKIESERITAQGEASYLDFNFLAKQVHLVLSGSSTTPLEVYIDGRPLASLHVNEDRKYEIADVPYGRHFLSLKIPKGISAYAFTFGDE